MEQVSAFKTSDGSLFATLDGAKEHEESLKWRERINEFANHRLCPYPSGAQRGMVNKIVVAWELFKNEPQGVA